ncbi:hypothetical protein NIES4101_29070 [Calothrix sp. NIES-4101]|nr:hypothetical protein NIES4101_29070 [Calothrix sp. NIES-4101]
MSRNLLFLPLLLLIFGTSITSSIAQTTNEEPGLRQFVERMLSRNGNETKVIVGKLPEKMPVKLPIPPASQILGSTVNENGSIQVVLDASGSVVQVTDFYQTQLHKFGWKVLEDEYQPYLYRGFVETRSPFGDYQNFCNQTNHSFSLGLSIRKGKESPSVVHMYVNPVGEKDDYYPCRKPSRVNYEENRVEMPILRAPLDTEVSGKEKDQDENQSEVILKTKLDSNKLANHYSQQLEKAGWKRIDSGESNSYYWTTWKLKDKEGISRQAIMSFAKVEGKPNQYFANLKIFDVAE